MNNVSLSTVCHFFFLSNLYVCVHIYKSLFIKKKYFNPRVPLYIKISTSFPYLRMQIIYIFKSFHRSMHDNLLLFLFLFFCCILLIFECLITCWGNRNPYVKFKTTHLCNYMFSYNLFEAPLLVTIFGLRA